MMRTGVLPVGTKTREAFGGLLLPGILDEITLDEITTKLSWRDLHSLSSVSRPWYHTIRSRRVYEARVRAGAVETLILMNYLSDYERLVKAVAVYSIREKSFYQLPLPPECHGRGLPQYCECICLDGKIYLLGGWEERPLREVEKWLNTHVYVLDLAGERKWQACASMTKGREDFGSAVIGGKIYVFGGTDCLNDIVYGAEVYDPKHDTWSPITPTKSLRFEHRADTLGEELVLHGGGVLDPGKFDYEKQQRIDPDDSLCFSEQVEDMDILEFYHPGKDEWREGKMSTHGIEFTAQGKLHALGPWGIEIYDVDKNSWTELHECCFPEIGAEDSNLTEAVALGAVVDEIVAVVALDDELVAVVKLDGKEVHYIYQCRGLGSASNMIVWEKVPTSLIAPEAFLQARGFFMCTIQL